MARLYADEDFPFPVVERLRQLGDDIITTLEAGQANQRIGDAEQLAFATGLGRAILTRNRRHFIRLHASSAQHGGIISITDDPDLDGQANRIDGALAGPATLTAQHVRVNRPNRPAKLEKPTTPKKHRYPRFRGLLRIRCVAETKRGREGRLARLPGLAAVDG